MQDAAATSIRVMVEQALHEEACKLDADVPLEVMAYRLASILVLLGQLDDDAKIPEELQSRVPLLCKLLESGNDSVQKNACGVLSGLMSCSEDVWRQLALQGSLVDDLVRALQAAAAAAAASTSSDSETMQVEGGDAGSTGGADPAWCINLVAALLAVAQGGEEGAQRVISCQGLPPILQLCATVQQDALQEGIVDVLCTLASSESCRPAMCEQPGLLGALCELLAAQDLEIRARALLCLGMLLPGSPSSQEAVTGSHPAAVQSLLALMNQEEDTNLRPIARDVFATLAQNPTCKEHIGAMLRSSAAANTRAKSS